MDAAKIVNSPDFQTFYPDSGLLCLVAMARFHQMAVEPTQIQHQFGRVKNPPQSPFDKGGSAPAQGDLYMGDTEILRAAKALNFKSSLVKTRSADLSNATLPAIAKALDGSYFILARVAQKNPPQSPFDKGGSALAQGDLQILVHDLRKPQPESIPLDVFEQFWSGELILLTRRGCGDRSRSVPLLFDIRWFIPALIKYRKLFGEVLLFTSELKSILLRTRLCGFNQQSNILA